MRAGEITFEQLRSVLGLQCILKPTKHAGTHFPCNQSTLRQSQPLLQPQLLMVCLPNSVFQVMLQA